MGGGSRGAAALVRGEGGVPSSRWRVDSMMDRISTLPVTAPGSSGVYLPAHSPAALLNLKPRPLVLQPLSLSPARRRTKAT